MVAMETKMLILLNISIGIDKFKIVMMDYSSMSLALSFDIQHAYLNIANKSR